MRFFVFNILLIIVTITMNFPWLSVLTEKRDAGLQESNEWPCRVVSYVMAQFSSLKTDL